MRFEDMFIGILSKFSTSFEEKKTVFYQSKEKII
jgi:hypothetical protein